MAGEPNSSQAGNVSGEWTRGVIDNLFEAEKKWLELASQQNALVLKTMREVLSMNQSAPNSAMGEWARQGLESFVEAQRKWVENVSQQQANFLASQRAMMEKTATDQNSEAANREPINPGEQPLEYLAEARRRWLDFAAQQNAQFLKAVREGMGMSESAPANTLSEMTRQAVENYVEVQKRWLNLATQWSFPRPR